jgi:hypothetical protein
MALGRFGSTAAGNGTRLVFGEPYPTQSWRLETLEAACRGAGIDCLMSPEIAVEVWRKFVFLAPFAGITCMGRTSIGADTLRVLNDEPKRLREVSGLGKKRVGVIAEAWQRARTRNEEKAFLAGLGLGPGMSTRVQRALGENAAQVVRKDPFVLAQLVDGIGFRRADEIARRLEVAPDSPQRLRAGLEFALAEFADARTIVRYNARFVARDAGALRPGDLLYFQQPSQSEPDHLMIYVGPSRFDGSAADFLVYHTGPADAGKPGEMRKVRLADLLKHPSPRWRPLASNERFVGVFRLAIGG